MGGAAYGDIWAGVLGPWLPVLLPRRAPGSNAAARLVECTPRRHALRGAARMKAADESASMRKISPPPAATRGTHCRPPRPPASLSLFAEEKEKKCSPRDLTSPRLHSRPCSPAAAAGET